MLPLLRMQPLLFTFHSGVEHKTRSNFPKEQARPAFQGLNGPTSARDNPPPGDKGGPGTPQRRAPLPGAAPSGGEKANKLPPAGLERFPPRPATLGPSSREPGSRLPPAPPAPPSGSCLAPPRALPGPHGPSGLPAGRAPRSPVPQLIASPRAAPTPRRPPLPAARGPQAPAPSSAASAPAPPAAGRPPTAPGSGWEPRLGSGPQVRRVQAPAPHSGAHGGPSVRGGPRDVVSSVWRRARPSGNACCHPEGTRRAGDREAAGGFRAPGEPRLAVPAPGLALPDRLQGGGCRVFLFPGQSFPSDSYFIGPVMISFKCSLGHSGQGKTGGNPRILMSGFHR